MRWFFVLMFLNAALFAADSIGKVIAVQGKAVSINANQVERPLDRGSPIHVAETIVVALDSALQIKFTDGSLLNLIEGTKYQVEAYRYKALLKKDHYTGNLLEGGFRNLSGSIAKKNPNEYEQKTPTATLGLRGTVIEANIVDGISYFGVDQGLVIVKNRAGSEIIGMGAKTRFCSVASTDEKPELLTRRPKVLSPQIFVEPPGGVNIDKTVQAQQNNANKFPGGSSSTGTSSSSSSQAAPASGTSASSPSSSSTPSAEPSSSSSSEQTATPNLFETETPSPAPTPQGSSDEGVQTLPGGGSGGVSIQGGC